MILTECRSGSAILPKRLHGQVNHVAGSRSDLVLPTRTTSYVAAAAIAKNIVDCIVDLGSSNRNNSIGCTVDDTDLSRAFLYDDLRSRS